MAQEPMTIQEAMAHAGLKDNRLEALEERARLGLPKYMWYYMRGKEKRGYCSACGCDVALRKDDAIPSWALDDPYIDTETEYDNHHPEWVYNLRGPYFSTRWNDAEAFDQSGKHGHFGHCPACAAIVQYRAFGRGRKGVRDRVFYIQYKKSAKEDGALVMLGWLCWQDWGQWDDYNDPGPGVDMSLREVCVFRPGKGGERFVAKPHWSADTQATDAGLIAHNQRIFGFEWERRRKCVGGFDPIGGMFNGPGTRFLLDVEALADAVEGTPWAAYSAMEPRIQEAYTDTLDLIDVFCFIARWPCVEYLCKLGFGRIAADTWAGQDEKCLNLRGKTAQAVFRVSGDDWGWMKGHTEDVTVAFLQTLRVIREKKIKISTQLLADGLRKWNSFSLKQMIASMESTRAAQAMKWCLKNRINAGDYADYLLQLKELQIDASDKAVLYPADFHTAHGRLTERIRHKANAAYDEQIKKRMDALGEYFFSALGLTLRPMMSSGEIIREGEIMQHCVGGYVKRYASGETVILCLREDERPWEPWRTVEFSIKGDMVQCRGKRNKSPEDEQERIDRFWELFAMYRKEYAQQHRKRRARRAA